MIDSTAAAAAATGAAGCGRPGGAAIADALAGTENKFPNEGARGKPL